MLSSTLNPHFCRLRKRGVYTTPVWHSLHRSFFSFNLTCFSFLLLSVSIVPSLFDLRLVSVETDELYRFARELVWHRERTQSDTCLWTHTSNHLSPSVFVCSSVFSGERVGAGYGEEGMRFKLDKSLINGRSVGTTGKIKETWNVLQLPKVFPCPG